jgi:geranylgeranyl pyrophosphate synthase
LLGGADLDAAEKLRDLGTLFGEVVQLHDDLLDTFQSPAAPDWTQGRPNLLILYARTADHPDRAQFVELLPRVGDSDALREAQQILIRCGAVSYCAYHLAERHRRARQLLAAIPLADATPMTELFAQLVRPLIELLRSVGAELPLELTELVP